MTARARGYHGSVTEDFPEQEPIPDELQEPEMDPTRPTEDSEELAEDVQEEVFQEEQTQTRP